MIIITATGNAGRDAEHRGNDRGPVVFSLAVSGYDRGTEEKRTDWYDVVCFGLAGKRARQDVTKGARVVVSGRLETRTHEDKEYRSIVAGEVEVMREGRGAPRQQQTGYGGGDSRQQHQDDEDVPF